MNSDTTNRPPPRQKRKRFHQPNRRLAKQGRIPTGMHWRISTGLNPPTAGRADAMRGDAISGVGRRKVVVAAETNLADLDAIPVAETPVDAPPNVFADRPLRRPPVHQLPVRIALCAPLRLSLRKRTMDLARDWTKRFVLRPLRNP